MNLFELDYTFVVGAFCGRSGSALHEKLESFSNMITFQFPKQEGQPSDSSDQKQDGDGAAPAASATNTSSFVNLPSVFATSEVIDESAAFEDVIAKNVPKNEESKCPFGFCAYGIFLTPGFSPIPGGFKIGGSLGCSRISFNFNWFLSALCLKMGSRFFGGTVGFETGIKVSFRLPVGKRGIYLVPELRLLEGEIGCIFFGFKTFHYAIKLFEKPLNVNLAIPISDRMGLGVGFRTSLDLSRNSFAVVFFYATK